MHGYNAQDLARSFQTVRNNTIKIAEEIPEDKYGFRPTDGSRTVAETLAHIAVLPRFGQKLHTDRAPHLEFSMFAEAMQRIAQQEAELKSKADLMKALRSGGDEFTKFLAGLSDEVLAEKVTFPPGVEPSTKTRFEMILGIKEHEMHHRAQLMVLERMLGITPHLTRDMEARRAQMQQQQQAGARA